MAFSGNDLLISSIASKLLKIEPPAAIFPAATAPLRFSSKTALELGQKLPPSNEINKRFITSESKVSAARGVKE
uniref:Uncharacterized protein n=1 Tax=Meloidogyne incognita TaxID=6306 RepID=A0A914LB44_MELIC